MLRALGIQNANSYRTHDLRRGHAKDLQLSNAPLSVILRAGEWRCTGPTISCALRSARPRSCAFLAYSDEHDLERDATVEAFKSPVAASERLVRASRTRHTLRNLNSEGDADT